MYMVVHTQASELLDLVPCRTLKDALDCFEGIVLEVARPQDVEEAIKAQSWSNFNGWERVYISKTKD